MWSIFNTWQFNLLAYLFLAVIFSQFFKLAMKNAKKDEILAKNIAYLEDRLLVFEEKPQVYGTQVRKNKETGNWEIYPLESPDKVDALRKSVELDSLQDYLKSFE